ncbi:MAG: hypothetical protein ACPGZP_09980 [Panacagrimonas sp.]
MNAKQRFSVTTLAVIITAFPAIAAAQPSASEVAKARAVCAQEKAKVQRLEAGVADPLSDPAILQARRQWEQACVVAQRLMVEAGMDQPARPPQPAAPPPVIEIPPEATAGTLSE